MAAGRMTLPPDDRTEQCVARAPQLHNPQRLASCASLLDTGRPRPYTQSDQSTPARPAQVAM